MGASAYKRCKDVNCTNKRCMDHYYLKANDVRTNLETRGPLSSFLGVWFREMKTDQQPQNPTEVQKLLAMIVSCLARGENPQKVGVVAQDGRTMDSIFDGYLSYKERDGVVQGTPFKQSRNFKWYVQEARTAFGALAPTDMNAQALETFVLGYLSRGCAAASAHHALRKFTSQACSWAAAQRPPLMVNPFGKFGFRTDAKFNRRAQRCEPHTEALLLAGCVALGVPWLADFIIIMIDLGCRGCELFGLTNADVNWTRHTVTFLKTKRKRGDTGKPENRTVPFNPTGRVAKILKRRLFAGATAHVIDVPVTKAKTTRAQITYRAWSNLLLHALCGVERTRGLIVKKGTTEWKKLTALDFNPHDLRHEAVTWWGEKRVARETREWLDGHASQFMDGRYDHSKEYVAIEELSAKVWPNENCRAIPSQSGPMFGLTKRKR
jgi:integrase